MFQKVKKKRVYRCVFAILVIAHCLFVIVNITRTFPVVDELAHLPAGFAHWQDHDFTYYRVNPPLSRLIAAAPALILPRDSLYRSIDYAKASGVGRPEFNVGYKILNQHGLDIANEFIVPRLTTLAFSIFGASLLALWVRQTAGRIASLVTLALWAFSPNMISNASVICTDIAACSMAILAGYATWRWSLHSTVLLAVLTGTGIGLSMLCKSTWIIGVVLFPLCFLLRSWQARTKGNGWCASDENPILRSYFPMRSITRLLTRLAGFGIVQVLICLIIVSIVVNAGYFFSGSFKSLGTIQFRSESLSGVAGADENCGNKFANSWIGRLPSPLPRDYLLGVDYLKWEVEGKMRSFLAGELRLGGWWYYYLVAIVIKTPLGTIILVGLGLPFLLTDYRPSLLLYLAMPALAVFICVSMAGGFNHHHRYVLSIYPVMFAAAGVAVGKSAPRTIRWRRVTFGSLLASLLVSVSSLTYPHSFFNCLVGGPYRGHQWLTNSNVEWGQDLLKLNQWIIDQGGDRPIVVRLAYPAYPEPLFNNRVMDHDRLGSVLRDKEWREKITGNGFFLLIHSNDLSDFPYNDFVRAVADRQPFEYITPAYRAYLFQGREDLALLDRTY